MKKNKTLPKIYFVAFLIALTLLTFTTVNGARATLSDESEIQTTEMQMKKIGVTIQEGDADKETWKDIASEPKSMGKAFSAFTEAFDAGKVYEDDFRVLNSGEIDEYIRVVVYKYWVKASDTATKSTTESKDYDGDATLINLVFSDSEKWVVDEKNSTNEKTILYYTEPVEIGKTTDVFLEGLMLDGAIKNEYTLIEKSEPDADGYYTVIYDYAYNGRSFVVQIEADAVQTHHAEDVIKSAWGRDVSISGETLKLS